MKINRKKLRFGSVAVALTVFIIAAVIILNVVFLALANNFRWYIDMTSERLFTLSDECRDMILNAIEGYTDENGNRVAGVNEEREKHNRDNGLSKGDEGYQEPVAVTVHFCADPDDLNGNTYMRYVHTTVLELAEACDFIEVDYLDWEYNPSSVQRFTTDGTAISSASVIIESGTEYRAYSSYLTFFINNDDGEYWAYNGEKRLAGSILAVTAAETPIACILTNHGESFTDTALLELLNDAGYALAQVDLSADENPFEKAELKDARLVVIYNPKSDFQVSMSSTDNAVDELARLEAFLNKDNSMMVFMSPETQVLPNFEEWLTLWGVKFDRHAGENGTSFGQIVKDTSYSLNDTGYAIRAQYIKSGGAGYSIYSGITKNGYYPPVIFENAMPISYADNYVRTSYNDDEDSSRDYVYGSYYGNGVSRSVYDVFTSSTSAVAEAGGKVVATGGSVPLEGVTQVIFADTDGAHYYLDAANDRIIDKSGNALTFVPEAGDTAAHYLTVSGKRLAVSGDSYGKTISTLDPTGGEVFTIIRSVTDSNGTVYSLSDDGVTIMSGGTPITPVGGRYETSDGNVLEIVTANGEKSIKSTTAVDPFRLMTITRQARTVQETNYLTTSQDTYVLVSGSLEFASAKYLQSAVFANSKILLAATTLMGRDVVPVGLEFKPFASFDISDLTDKQANLYTVLLAVLPPVIIFGVGVAVLVRRKYS